MVLIFSEDDQTADTVNDTVSVDTPCMIDMYRSLAAAALTVPHLLLLPELSQLVFGRSPVKISFVTDDTWYWAASHKGQITKSATSQETNQFS